MKTKQKAKLLSKDKSTGKPAAKASAKEKKELSPLEKARLAKAGGKAKGSKAAPKKAKATLPTWKAPDDFKPHFLEVVVKTEKDGLLGSAIKATRYQGRYDPQVDDKKKADLGSYDPATLQGILARISATTYATNAAKRLPANTTFKILLRVGKKVDKNAKGQPTILTAAFKNIWMGVLQDSGRVKAKELDKKDPNYRKFRKSSRILPAAFKDVLMPPKRVRGKKVDENAED